jgi:hypothetical protein
MFDFTNITKPISTLITDHYLDRYARLLIALAVTAFCVYAGTLGLAGNALYYAGVHDLAANNFLAHGQALAAMAGATYALWRANAPKDLKIPASRAVDALAEADNLKADS